MPRLRLRHTAGPSCQRLTHPLFCLPHTVQPGHGPRRASSHCSSAKGTSIATTIATTTTTTTTTTVTAAEAWGTNSNDEDASPAPLPEAISDNERDYYPSASTDVDSDAELRLLLQLLPPAVRVQLEARSDLGQLMEVVLDLGRPPSARFPHGDVDLGQRPLTAADLQQAVDRVGHFDGDNRAGIDRTLHRISAIRNRAGRVIGLTCRVGRCVPGAAALVRDLVLAGHSVLLLGRPGVGKTTALREVCRIAADEAAPPRRVVVVDTSNEIGGDGDVPHASIGGARRMQVPRPEAQHEVMVEAVENHMPQVIVIDEISTLAECAAARTIAQRGVQLVATAHGNQLQNVIKNPTLADLVGGIQSVTLGDEEARRRGVQKSVLERAAPPTFDVAVEMEERGRWRVHLDVGAAVDTILAGGEASGQVRFVDDSGRVTRANFMGTVRRTDSATGVTTTSEWWADEAGEREALLWPVRQHVTGTSSSPTSPSTPSSSSSSSPSSSPSPSPSASSTGSRMPRPRAPGSPGASAPSITAATAAAASLSAAFRSNASAASASSSGGSGSWSSSRSSSSGGHGSSSGSSGSIGGPAADGWGLVEQGGDQGEQAAAAPPPLPRLRAHLVMDDEAAARVRAVLGLLRREAYEAAVAAAAAGGGSGAAADYSASSSTGGGGGDSVSGSESLIELVPDLDMADLVIGTKSKLRNTPKVRNAARKRDLPVYALTATSTSALLRNLCPLLGLDPLAVAEVVRAAGGGGAGGGASGGAPGRDEAYDSEEEMLTSVDGEGEDGEQGLTGSSSGGGGGGGHRRSLELSAADDYAELLATTVRELRYAPLDRSYAQHVLSRFVEEMTAAEEAAAGSAGASGDPLARADLEAAVRSSSLAAVAWSCGFVKHRKKFVEASRRELGLLAEACGRRWGRFSAGELLRVAGGFAGLRLAPPSAAWLQGLTTAAAEALEEGSAGSVAGGMAACVLSADEASRLRLAVAELELLWLEAERQQRAGS